MEMCYDNALVMPKSYSIMNEEEMTYVEGGSKNVAMSDKFLTKSYCTWYASMMLRRSEVSGMLDHEIAEELYAHAVCFYKYDKVALLVGIPLTYYCYSNAKDGIAIMDGGDDAIRKAFYSTVWTLF